MPFRSKGSLFFYLFSSFLGANPLLVGEYENLAYSGSNKNNYHYATITYDSSNSLYLWENRANRVYKLHPTDKEDELRVDESVPYYNSGWKIAIVTSKGIYAMCNAFYTRMY